LRPSSLKLPWYLTFTENPARQSRVRIAGEVVAERLPAR
jgi:hypothetical protein